MKNKMKFIDLSKKLKPYEGKWVALSFDYQRIFSSGSTLADAIKNLKEKNVSKVVFMKVLPFDLAYVPTTI